jgi:hypothetical protein
VVANIDGHWRLIWSLTSGPVEISRGAHKLTLTPHVKRKKKKNLELYTHYLISEGVN